jgi:hypothetical protein
LNGLGRFAYAQIDSPFSSFRGGALVGAAPIHLRLPTSGKDLLFLLLTLRIDFVRAKQEALAI